MGSEAQPDAPGYESLRAPREAVISADFRVFAEALPYMAWVCGPDGQLRYLNGTAFAYWGEQLVESIRLFPPGAVFHADDREIACALWEQAVRCQQNLSLEVRLRRSDGALRWHLVQANPVLDDAGQVVKWMGACMDVHNVRESRDLNAFLLKLATDFARIDNPHQLLCTAMVCLRERLDAAQVALTELDHVRGEAVVLLQGRGEAANLQVANLNISGYDELTTDARQGLMTVVRDLHREDTAAARLYDGWYGLDDVRAIVSAPLLQGGCLVASLSVVEDTPRNWTAAEVELTKRVAEIVWPALEKVRSDRALAVSEQRLRLAQTVAQIGTWELEPEAGTAFFSPEGFELFGLAPESPELYRQWTSRIDPRDSEALPALIAECRSSGSARTEYRYRHPKRGLRWIYCRAGRIQDAGHNFLVGISLDITERRQAEEALQDVNQRKDEFLAMLAHELRNPLASIRNATRMLRVHSQQLPELDWARRIIDRQTSHLVRLVDDLLDVSRMIRGKIVLKKANIDLSELVQHALETSEPLIRDRHHRLHVHLPAEPVAIEGDLTRLAQVLANLLNNAAKYTDEGGDIWLEAWQRDGQATLRVRDSGPGISLSLLPHVFDLFTQAERTLDRSQGGLGIGLTLVKLLVEMHGGSVEARNSDGGHGAEFTVHLPAGAIRIDGAEPAGAGQAASATVRASPARAAPMKILVVDDNVDAADSIALLLSIDGFEARSVHSAMSALDIVSSFGPDVLLLDIGLPVMNGYELAERLRTHIPVERMKIVALSGYGQPSDRERATRAGFDDYLVKPVEPAVLSGYLRSLQS